MLSLDIKMSKSFAYDFQIKYIQNLIDARDTVINNGIEIVQNKTKKRLYVSKANKKFLQTKLTDRRLWRIISLTPKQQIHVINLFKKHFPTAHNKKTKIYQFLKYIFITSGYEKLNGEAKQEFYSNLKIQTCIYCNRNYIFNLKENGHIKGHIDHFYPKAKYPYLAMSYFNFMPVCESCNKVKGEFDTADESKNIIHPYLRNNNKIFSIQPTVVDEFSFKLKPDDLLKELHIEKIYNIGHKDIIQEMYVKFFQQDTKEHFDSLRKSLTNIGFDDDEIHRFISCGYLEEKNHHKRSLSKVIKDLQEEFDEIYNGVHND